MARSRYTFDEAIQVVVAPLISWAQFEWFRQVDNHVPGPYLDEVFHIPQANAFWKGNWSHWDDKITTPPGLYLYSISASHFLNVDPLTSKVLSPFQLRWTNFLLVYLLLFACVIWRWTTGPSSSLTQGVLIQELCVLAFPLFFFFSALYYTDLFAAFTVMCTYASWQAGLKRTSYQKFAFQLLHLFSGLISLTSRQTNIFWSSVFLGGLQVVHTVKQKTRIHDPPIADAYFEDFATTIISLATSALSFIPQLLLDLWPHLGLLAAFGAFIVWNGGVVLGDKSNHTAGLHLSQMLYLWPFLVFFSWPLIIPQLAHLTQIQRRIPRLWLLLGIMTCMLAVVHYNTVVHPFLLADNRHYTFYVFKLLRSRVWSWYAMIPVYFISAWLSIQALGSRMTYSGGPGMQGSKGSKGRRLSTSSGKGDVAKLELECNRISFLIVWILSTSLSLVTAPLVEPRYYIIPWLIWRLHVPQPTNVLKSTSFTAPESTMVSRVEDILSIIAKRTLWLELTWYMIINLVTCYVFLNYGFEWPQEAGNIQRFMW